MVSTEAIRTILGVAGNITAVTLFLSTVPTFLVIWKKRSVEQYSPVPYLASFFNCGLWVLYGMPFVHPHSLLVVTTNGAGVAIELVYLLIFLMCSDKRKRLKVALIMLLEILFFGVLVILMLIVVHTPQQRSTIVGSISVAANILMYAAPLSVMVPNGIGALLGILQLVLYATFYKSTKRMLAARKEKTEMGLAVIDTSKNQNGNVAHS
ncbi:hypothetical protein Ccrd_006195 [Cynara cardunculus var. scolymus]|uniref:SWEET sugar transporter n=1 Tax=Cynara cardunculus var. scolymus TaxID=59895 RepID=A0A103XJ82_CYNCS|nr:hypothetical protein Ccrd_006195 [Cynara cardunculus var. scolymus]